ncbi:RNA polymerase sigma factor [Sphingomonas hankyongi]|uniref:RNA polymerase sigma factor n=1 Tax=Sphingomonas hankyongi TaxID=2908209 RepID=A0ABT0S3T7_9SPHN|nr:RNA polymerase sigma factor [Sphingomonas hankyongi]
MTAQHKLDYSSLVDAELAALCVRRDPDAVRYILTVNNQRLFRAAWSILKDRSEAEEVLQVAYVSAFASMARFEGRSSLTTWLTRIVINESLSRLRSERRRRASLEADGVSVLNSYREKLMRGSDTPPPDVAIAREQLRLLLERVVAELPDIFRTVFVLREIDGLSVEDTAGVLHIPPATVKTRLLRAKRRLQQALAPDVHEALTGTFPFAGADCAALTERVMVRLGYPHDRHG